MRSQSHRARYYVNYGVATSNGGLGQSDRKLLQHSQLEFMLCLLSPFEYESWMHQVTHLRRHDYTIIRLDEVQGDGLRLVKLIRIERV